MINDLHIHTIYSCDSDSTKEGYCQKAISNNMKYICFTDHVDFNRHDYGYDFIIGSIHWVGDMFPCKEIREKYSASMFYELYWKEVIRAV